MSGVIAYNDAVREAFAHPRHAGDLDRDCGQVLEAEAAESGQGAQIALAAGIDEGRISALRFRVSGCPHLIAALEVFCRRHEGGPAAGLEKPDFAGISEELELPVEKSGRILLLEDAVARLWSQYTHAGQ